MVMFFSRFRILGLAAVFLMAVRCASGYSLLTHEQLIDLTWKDSIVPLLKSRYPTLTEAQLEHARAYAYGGCVIQDIGYYPFGDELFSNLTHYVRSGDFVVNLFRNAGNADELAFAVGALSHYIGDSMGHSMATNLAVPVEFPKLGKKYGASVNYAQGEHQHVQTEFAFDINEIVHHRMAPVYYLRHIGLQVPTKQLALAFYQTYGLGEDFELKRGRRVNVADYRWAVRTFIPRIAYAVTLLHRDGEPSDPQIPEAAELIAKTQQVAAENNWDAYRKKAGFGTYCLAGLIYVLPKIGPLKMVSVKGPRPATEAEYLHSVSVSAAGLHRVLVRFTPPPTQGPGAALAAAADTKSQPPPGQPLPANPNAQQDIPRLSADPRHPLVNRDLDTGMAVKPGSYPLTDATYAALLHRLAAQSKPVPPGLKADILAYYADDSAPIATKKNAKRWAEVQADLVVIRGLPISNEPDPFATYGSDDMQ